MLDEKRETNDISTKESLVFSRILLLQLSTIRSRNNSSRSLMIVGCASKSPSRFMHFPSYLFVISEITCIRLLVVFQLAKGSEISHISRIVHLALNTTYLPYRIIIMIGNALNILRI